MRCQLQQLCHKSALLVWPSYLGTLFFCAPSPSLQKQPGIVPGCKYLHCVCLRWYLGCVSLCAPSFPITPSNTVRKVTVTLIVSGTRKCKCNCVLIMSKTRKCKCNHVLCAGESTHTNTNTYTHLHLHLHTHTHLCLYLHLHLDLDLHSHLYVRMQIQRYQYQHVWGLECVCVCGVCVLVQVLMLVWVMLWEGKCWGVGNGTLTTT